MTTLRDIKNTYQIGDCIEVLRTIPDETFHCCVTSPPYWGLRDYGHDGQIGLEETPDEYVAKIVEVFDEIRRTLRDDGTLWLNLGDSYAGSWGAQGRTGQMSDRSVISARSIENHPKKASSIPKGSGLKPKDLVGIPWRVAFALQAAGWYLRQDIIWHKPNPMPESVTDRCTKAHEYIFLLSKSPRYYYDAESIKEAVTGNAHSRGSGKHPKSVVAGHGVKANASFSEAITDTVSDRNRRSVWTVSTKPYSGAHFATFPEDLIKPCILAGCPEGGVVLDPFFGSGTVGRVSEDLGRRWFGIELNPEYAPLIDKRTSQCGLF